MNLLITGGLGYIGAHLAVELLKSNANVFILDDLSNSKIQKKKNIEKLSKKKIKFIKNDLSNYKILSKILKKNKIHTVFHLAGSKAVNESFFKPYKYYLNNSFKTMQLLRAMHESDVNNIIFSSSATVYGVKNKNGIKEDGYLEPINPYGTSKLISEKLIIDQSKIKKKFNYIILRYFNPIGYHPSGLLSDDKSNDNLVPNLINKLRLKKPFLIYGRDYDTKDGTAIRDYIHINDLISAHVSSLKYLYKNKNEIFNVGTGKGYSVLEILKTFDKVLNRKITKKFVKRRKGDPAIIYCSNLRIKKKLNWRPMHNLKDMCKYALNKIY
ncbi:UDP-glucose 4-epimerase GalE [Candidatus Pelagibacter sp.]|uniref:UDP-glucose 4-epimerase GalE n=1 Tax=Candidatus Pelagibacter sp. TaxID=2024849 RepID=UPI003F838778